MPCMFSVLICFKKSRKVVSLGKYFYICRVDLAKIFEIL